MNRFSMANMNDLFPNAQRFLRCRKSHRYFTGNGWTDDSSLAQAFPYGVDAARGLRHSQPPRRRTGSPHPAHRRRAFHHARTVTRSGELSPFLLASTTGAGPPGGPQLHTRRRAGASPGKSAAASARAAFPFMLTGAFPAPPFDSPPSVLSSALTPNPLLTTRARAQSLLFCIDSFTAQVNIDSLEPN